MIMACTTKRPNLDDVVEYKVNWALQQKVVMVRGSDPMHGRLGSWLQSALSGKAVDMSAVGHAALGFISLRYNDGRTEEVVLFETCIKHDNGYFRVEKAASDELIQMLAGP